MRAQTDASGATTGSGQYDAFGVPRGQTGTQSTYGFRGRQTDAESGLSYAAGNYYEASSASTQSVLDAGCSVESGGCAEALAQAIEDEWRAIFRAAVEEILRTGNDVVLVGLQRIAGVGGHTSVITISRSEDGRTFSIVKHQGRGENNADFVECLCDCGALVTESVSVTLAQLAADSVRAMRLGSLPGAERLIREIIEALSGLGQYDFWDGPNSNSIVFAVLSRVLGTPPTADELRERIGQFGLSQIPAYRAFPELQVPIGPHPSKLCPSCA